MTAQPSVPAQWMYSTRALSLCACMHILCAFAYPEARRAAAVRHVVLPEPYCHTERCRKVEGGRVLPRARQREPGRRADPNLGSSGLYSPCNPIGTMWADLCIDIVLPPCSDINPTDFIRPLSWTACRAQHHTSELQGSEVPGVGPTEPISVRSSLQFGVLISSTGLLVATCQARLRRNPRLPEVFAPRMLTLAVCSIGRACRWITLLTT
ncbi:hypothetical protein OH76DRAFT_1001871 [Lentinus brumalis]|uniref:Uncharacterized protein n=1 Tax=Lentinus brumalis TaxID=2498619 RepID=A0A371DQL7_9APHY|nr:hypothetical protein OH76DRAFT_1001871 [Polyporus brumalis]